VDVRNRSNGRVQRHFGARLAGDTESSSMLERSANLSFLKKRLMLSDASL